MSQHESRPDIHSVIFDWKRTLYDPDNHSLIEGAEQVLSNLHAHTIPLHIIGMGEDDMYGEVERLGISGYVDTVTFLKESKSDDVFRPFIDEAHPESTLVVGDRIRSELQVGNRLGATTVWVRQGKFQDETPGTAEQNPHYEVSSLIGFGELLTSEFGLIFDATDLLTK